MRDTATGEFKGTVSVEYDTEMDAKKAYTGMLGLNVDN